MGEWAFICMTDQAEILGAGPSAAKQEEFTNWQNTFCCEDDSTIRAVHDTGLLCGVVRNLFPKVKVKDGRRHIQQKRSSIWPD